MNLLEQEAQPHLSYRTIPLTQGKVALVDECDYATLIARKWNASKDAGRGHFYAVSYEMKQAGIYRYIRMQRLIMACPKGMQVDHVNGDTLDNRRCNLRVVTASENGRNRGMNRNNTSGYKGVRFHKEKGKFQAYLNVNRKFKHIGYFTTAEEAYEAYKMAALKLHGEFARFA